AALSHRKLCSFNSGAALLARSNPRTVPQDLMRHPGLLGAVRADQHHVGDIDRRFPIEDPTLPALTRVRFHMALDHVYAFDQDPVAPRQTLDNPAALTLVFPGYNSNPVILANIYLYIHILGQLRCIVFRLLPGPDSRSS